MPFLLEGTCLESELDDHGSYKTHPSPKYESQYRFSESIPKTQNIYLHRSSRGRPHSFLATFCWLFWHTKHTKSTVW